jgi:hypothetical protein
MGMGVAILVSLLLVAATVIMHYEFLQFAGTLPSRLTVPTRPRIIWRPTPRLALATSTPAA